MGAIIVKSYDKLLMNFIILDCLIYSTLHEVNNGMYRHLYINIIIIIIIIYIYICLGNRSNNIPVISVGSNLPSLPQT